MPQNPTPAAAGDTTPTTNLTPEREAEIRADLAAIPAPPWRWIGLRGGGGPELVTDHSGRQYLLRAAKPTDHRGDELLDPETDAVVYGDLEFRDQRRGETYSLMRSGNSLAVGRTEYDPDAIVGVANPIARWVEKSAQHATDLLAEVDRLRTELGKVTAFAAQRAEYVTSILNCHPDNAHDYYRWQGHAESRRQLSEQLGLPVAWPAETEPRTAPTPAEDPEGGSALCRCGHGAAYHDAKYSDPQCRLCPEDGERMWRHPFTPADASAPSQREAGAL